MYDDLGLFQRFCFFGRHEVLEAIDEVNDLHAVPRIDKGEFVCSCWWLELYLRVSLYFFRAFSCLFLFVCLFVFAFYGVLSGNCN